MQNGPIFSFLALKRISLIAVLALASGAGFSATPYTHDAAKAEELRVRDGLPNVFAKLQAGGPVNIAYFGGSITAAAGWRPKTLAWFQAQYPQAKVNEINAAISGTGSDYGACRLEGDVLAKNPDLIFLECRVNGGGGFEKQSVEGIVRHIWKTHPKTDICFVYTIGEWMVKDLQAGKPPMFGQAMETIANAYGIPTVDLGVEIVKRLQDGSLLFKGPAPVAGKLVFSADGVHPGDAGHDVYRDVIARSMLTIKATGTAQPHAIPAPLTPTNWETATLIPVTQASLSTGWTPIDIDHDPVYNDDKGRTHAMLRGGVKCSQTGATLTVKWTGTSLGLSDIPYGEPTTVEAAIDGGKPLVFSRAQSEQKHKYARFWYLPEQSPGPHTVTFTVKSLPPGNTFYAGQILVIGTIVP